MSFDLPNLDVMRAEQVVDQLVRSIQGIAPGWTDYNPSDPGITLLQMLAWLCDGTAYTANAVPLETYRNMLRWVLGLSSAISLPSEAHYATDFPYSKYADTQSQDGAYETLKNTLEQVEMGAPVGFAALQEAVVAFRRTPFLAITPADLAALVQASNAFIDAQAQKGAATSHVARLCQQRRGDATDLFLVSDAACTYSAPTGDASGTFSISLTSPIGDAQSIAQESALLKSVRRYLAARALLGNAMSVSSAQLVYLDVECVVSCFARERADEVAAAVLSALQRAVQPVRLDGGRDWAYGVSLDSESLLPLIESVAGVDRIRGVAVEVFRPQAASARNPVVPEQLARGLPRLHGAWVTVQELGDD
ncbi:hypothetical protein WKR88_26030 [Trinickia caryophylli]|uniref:Baseplate J-like protein n=1 Tax=Trinickia caryophylli TaxID=28094 RepID=A0A1X7GBC2_TRICW|nr:hypothetical protein [Trinickia caryophylli]PMS11352.1 hypothetical protein C0Z17_14490 [Trinickia caryophylli]TRX17545.1 hypothetical protein FNF07_04410 [Trinickia caryophylli]WQE11708.1 hypothetical protein U0034_18510 [Trinickia caryophylli]SMF66674.1 hypothetical protein SAMN06295900_114141 [Trinickia caryophylli]GLU34893.1 hypothetical protein Busp01_47350 [Trinickia caryophylli]